MVNINKKKVINDIAKILVSLFEKYPQILNKWDEFRRTVDWFQHLKHPVIEALDRRIVEKTHLCLNELVTQQYAPLESGNESHQINVWKKILDLLL
jgi:hypothetical protein